MTALGPQVPEKVLRAGTEGQVLTVLSGTPSWVDPVGVGSGSVTVGVIASRPAAATAGAGALYYATDARSKWSSNDAKGVMSISTGSAWQSVSRTITEELGWFNVLDYGMAGDWNGSTGHDNSGDVSTLTALLDANRAGTLYFPSAHGGGKYYFSTGMTAAASGLTIIGEAQTGASSGFVLGCTQFIVGDGVWGLTLGNAAATDDYRGYRVENIMLYEKTAGGATGGLRLLRVGDSSISRVAAGSFTAGTGIHNDGTGGNGQYNTFTDCRVGKCAVGFRNTAGNGTRLIGGYFEGAVNGLTPTASSIGLKVTSGDSFRSIGTIFQGYDTIMELGANANHEVTAFRAENWTTQLAHVLTGNYAAKIEGTAANSIRSNAGVGCVVDSGATDVYLNVYFRAYNTSAYPTTNDATTIYGPRTGILSQPGGVATKFKDGPIGDADYNRAPPDGSIAVDRTNKRIQIRINGGWYYGATLTALVARNRNIDLKGTASTGVTTRVLTVTGATIPAGHHVIGGTCYGLSSTPSITVTDSKSNTYAVDARADLNTGNTPHAAIFSAKVTTPLVAGDTITITYGTAVNYPSAAAYEYSGIASSSWLDQQNAATGSSTTPNSGNITTTTTQSAVFGVVCSVNGITFTADAGWTALDHANVAGFKAIDTADQISLTTSTYAMSGTLSSSDWAACIAAYKGA